MRTAAGDDELLASLARLGIIPRQGPDVYRTALRHRSTGHRLSNERLEFLGDSVLATVVSAYLCERYPGCDEGFLTKMRTKLVRGTTLASLGRVIGLSDMLVVSGTEASRGRHETEDALEDALEALIGAVFVDKGFDAAAAWTTAMYESHFDFSEAIKLEVTAKERLISIARSRGEALEFESPPVLSGHKAVIRRKAAGSAGAGDAIGVGDGDTRKAAVERAAARAIRWYTGTG